MSKEAVRSLNVAKRIPRAQIKKRKLAREIMEFGGKIKPSIRDERCAQFHRELSTITDRMNISELKEFKKSIQMANEDSWFPVSAIMGRTGSAANHIADFLGERYVDSMLWVARSRGDIDNVRIGKEYLEWASEYGGENVRARALAGVAKVAADEIAMGNGDFLEREMIKSRGIMRVLRRHVGEKEAWEIVKEQAREEGTEKKVAAGISFMAGVCVAAAYTIAQSVSELRDVSTLQLAVMGASAITGVVAGLSFLATINMGMLQRRVRKLLGTEHGHV
jgi:hypothetical protein